MPSGIASFARPRLLLRIAAILAALYFLHFCYQSWGISHDTSGHYGINGVRGVQPLREAGRKALVVASLRGDDTAWLEEHFSDWERHIYVVDDPTAALTVPRNKGRESNVYLTFLIDHYHDLPEYMVFIHSLRYQWHNEDPMYDGVPMLKNLRLNYVKDEGYANLRCTWTIGCPREVKPRLEPVHVDENAYSTVRVEAAFAEMYRIFFPGSPVPPEVGVNCGAQFALSRQKVLERPRSDYQFYRRWLLDTKEPDSISGRMMEYTWHMIMGKPAVHCPHTGDCFCQKYGLCNLTCEANRCEKRYQLPQYANIPKGWPEFGTGENGFPAKGWAD